jgi:hypothetical protein
MDDGFHPLLPGSGSAPGGMSASGRLKILPAGEAQDKFQPVTPDHTAAASAPSCAAPQKPTITLQRDGQRVTHIRIQCSCGQVINLDCEY